MPLGRRLSFLAGKVEIVVHVTRKSHRVHVRNGDRVIKKGSDDGTAGQKRRVRIFFVKSK